MNSSNSIINLTLSELQQRSKNRMYQTDYQAWKADVLGFRTYKKMEEITNEALFGEKTRTLVKSSNGTSKSFEVAAMICWVASVFPPGEAISIISAPSVQQIEKVIFAYLKANYNTAIRRNKRMRGWINEALEWKHDSPSGNINLAFGRKPPPQDAVSVFQGIRSQFGNTFVFFDEAGGMDKSLWTAAEAILTGANARFIGIGNPDNTGTEFHRNYIDPVMREEFNLFTISSFDLPTLTGEVVYPDDPEMEARMLASLTQAEWVEHKKRIWGEKDARYLAKVLGEFPGDGGNAFFGQDAINFCYDSNLPDDNGTECVLGVDIARYGEDESVVYSNRGGRIRLIDTWGRTDTVTSADKVHEIALEEGAVQINIDTSGIGGAVYDQLEMLPKYRGAPYILVGIDNGHRSPDETQWSRVRSYNHDLLRSKMVAKEIDFDIEDKELREQLQAITYRFNPRGALQITPKDEMRTVMGGSPDRLDAVIYSIAEVDHIINSPLADYSPGDIIVIDPLVMFELDLNGPGRPL